MLHSLQDSSRETDSFCVVFVLPALQTQCVDPVPLVAAFTGHASHGTFAVVVLKVPKAHVVHPTPEEEEGVPYPGMHKQALIPTADTF
jgi:hypothetical protein